MDIAAVELDDGVKAEFVMHGHNYIPLLGSLTSLARLGHTNRRILGGVKEPERRMSLTRLGAASGEAPTVVKQVNREWRKPGSTFLHKGVTFIDSNKHPVKDGDSGGPCLYKVDDSNYKMCCVIFAKDQRFQGAWVGVAIPASTVEEKLGLKFGNTLPVANAGSDRIVDPLENVTLNGTASDEDGDTLTYYWDQWVDDEYPSLKVNLSNHTTLTPNFTAPQYHPATLKFRLIVTDRKGESTVDEMSVDVVTPSGKNANPPPRTIPGPVPTPPPQTPSQTPGVLASLLPINHPPLANAGANQTVDSGVTVTLDGSGSSDEDEGDTLTYRWEQLTVGPAPRVTLSGVSSVSATFTAPTGPASLFFRLTVTDNHETFDTDNIVVTVKAPTPMPTPDPTPPSQPVNTWVATGNTRGCGPTYEYEESLYSGSGALYFRWVSDPQTETWGAWADTGNTMSIGGGVWVKEQTRTSDCGNTETQWVSL